MSTGAFSNFYSESVSGIDSDLITADRSDYKTKYAENNVFVDFVNLKNASFYFASSYMLPKINTALKSADYGNEFLFNRIWIQPQSVSYGFIVEGSTTDIKIWNAWRSRTIQLTAVSIEDGDGTDLDYPSLPDTFRRSYDDIYVLTVYKDGPPSQDTLYTLTIDGDDYEIVVTGLRIIPFFVDINWDTLEIKYEFNTTIFSTDHLVEQRRPLTDESWFNFSFDFDVSADTNRKIFNIISYAHDKVLGVPVYNQKMSVVSMGADSVTVNEDPSYMYNLSDSGYAAIVDHQNTLMEIKSISSIVGSVITFDQNITLSFGDVRRLSVYPCVFVIINSYKSFSETDDFDTMKIELREFKNG
jgi:hypothetical protein